MNLFHQHKAVKKQSVSLYDRVSAGLGVCGGLLVAFSLAQPKTPANSGRLLAAFLFFGASVAVERIREDDVQSLDRAEEFERNVQSERIRQKAVLGEYLHVVDEAEELYRAIPIDRHEEFADIIGVKPPNYEARQAVQQASQPQPATVATMPDPTGDFDPEESQSLAELSHYLVPAALVENWFEGMTGRLPQELIDKWRSNPGKAIEVNGAEVNIIRGEL